MMTAEKNILASQVNLDSLTSVYLIGIGGIGMSALARYFKSLGKSVSGYDKTETALTEKLKKEGIDIHFNDSIDSIGIDLENSSTKELLVIYTPAIPKNHSELNHLLNSKFTVIKRSAALGLIVSSMKGLAVAGTHGKTTTSTILAHIIHESDEPVTAFLGGISSNFSSNFIHTEGSNTAVVEADEYDRSFLSLHPFGAVITSTDADHLDIYGEEDELLNSFIQFSNQVSGSLLVNQNYAQPFLEKMNCHTYGWSAECDYSISERKLVGTHYKMTFQTPEGPVSGIEFSMPGKHNSENALAAFALGCEAGLSPDKLAKAFKSFKGIKRRFEIIISSDKQTYIDDYAHHPSEINAAISAAREINPDQELVGVFQPHLFSRTRDFADEFASSLSKLDRLILLDIYPAREEPITGISSAWLAQKVTTNVTVLEKQETLDWISTHKPSFLMTLGAGNIDQLVEPIKNILS